jgi:hypothetical protein
LLGIEKVRAEWAMICTAHNSPAPEASGQAPSLGS